MAEEKEAEPTRIEKTKLPRFHITGLQPRASIRYSRERESPSQQFLSEFYGGTIHLHPKHGLHGFHFMDVTVMLTPEAPLFELGKHPAVLEELACTSHYRQPGYDGASDEAVVPDMVEMRLPKSVIDGVHYTTRSIRGATGVSLTRSYRKCCAFSDLLCKSIHSHLPWICSANPKMLAHFLPYRRSVKPAQTSGRYSSIRIALGPQEGKRSPRRWNPGTFLNSRSSPS
jgi:hypothetical protein